MIDNNDNNSTLDGGPTNQTPKSLRERAPITHKQRSFDMDWSAWRDYTSKGIRLMTMSMTMFTWNTIQFRLHGFWLCMLAVDMVWSMIRRLSPSWPFLVLIRNTILFIIIIGICFIRIKVFGTNQNEQEEHTLTTGDIIQTTTADDNQDDDVELGSISTTTTNGQQSQQPQEIEQDTEIRFGSVTITYCGHNITLKSMSKSTRRQYQYFSFSAFFHCALAIIFWNLTILFSQEAWLYEWLRNANMYCMIHCLLPVPGFDGGGLLTIFLKHRDWGKYAITATLLLSSVIVTISCGLMALVCLDVVAFYLAVYCAFHTIKYVLAPQDPTMRVLRSMAQTTTSTATPTTSDATIPRNIMQAPMASSLV